MKWLPKKIIATFAMRFFAIAKIPLVFFVRPSVSEISDDKIVIKIPFRRRNKNHIGSMYFGAMAIGAELAPGILAMQLIRKRKQRISLVFKHFTADFLKRAEGNTFFTCSEGKSIDDLINTVIESEDRQELKLNVTATVPAKFDSEPVAKFTMTISLKGK